MLGRRAALAVLREVSGARKSRLLREDADDCHESGAERTGGLDEQEGDADVAAEGVGVLPIALGDVAGALGAVVLVVGGVADLLEAEDELAQLLLGAAKGVDVALGGGWRSALVVRAEAQRDGLVVRGVGLELVVEQGGGDAAMSGIVLSLTNLGHRYSATTLCA